ncbi:MAG: hypothetical protein K5880_06555 [Hydrogenophaga sp.]|uniref:hypothetical protein n=1 Tax=Hydrogenophaga sp. TaxID=1904254 RepID=UPI0026244D0C|nr:hypothetical protein [Hydrogenophaga sp.]MCV0438272.1 hypothetical protein [Hydrogenophaga sp.]
MSESSIAEHALIERFLESLQELPGARAETQVREAAAAGPSQVGAEIHLNIAGKPVILWVEVKKTAYPRDVRQVLWQFQSRHQAPSSHAQPLLVAESLSPGAKALLKSERIGYYDSGGSLFLPIPGAYVYIDRPPSKTLERSVRSLFSGRRAQVLHALLIDHQDWFGVTQVAERAQVAPSTVSDVLGELERFDWLESRGQGPAKERHLREPAALLDAWAGQLARSSDQAVRRYYVPGLKSDALLQRLGEVFNAHQVSYAVSFEAAAQRYAPFLSGISQVRTRLLPSTGADAAMAELDARVVAEGANLVVIAAKSAGELLFRQQVGGVWLASPVQVYLDLLQGEGRAKEMAEHLRRERIGF